MSWQTLAVFLTTCFFLSMTPGPNMLLAMGLGVRFGARRAAWGGVGMCTALAGMAALSGLGLGALLSTSGLAFQALKWAGATYLVWLGVLTWRALVEPASTRDQGPAWDDGGPGHLALRGALVAASNPKAIVFMAALFPQFLEPKAALLPQLVTLVSVMVVIEFGWIMAYAVGGEALAARLSSPRAARALNRLTGGLLIGAGGLLAVARLG